MKQPVKTTARGIQDTATRLGWTVHVRGSILTISKKFTPEDRDALVTCDTEYGSILNMLPNTHPGSVWGTDCGGMGALRALKSGHFIMNKSGGSKRVLTALSKLI